MHMSITPPVYLICDCSSSSRHLYLLATAIYNSYAVVPATLEFKVRLMRQSTTLFLIIIIILRGMQMKATGCTEQSG